MKNLFFAVMALAMFASCNNAGKSNSESETKSAEACVPSVSVDSFLAVAADYIGKEITVQGTVHHVCKHGGKKVKIYTSCASHSVHGVATETLGVFEADIEGSEICMTGIVVEDRMTLDDIDAWEAKIEAAKAEEMEADHAKGYDHHASAEQIQKHRELVAKSDSGYIASYHIDVASYKVCEVASDSTEVKEACCSKKDSAVVAATKAKGDCCKKDTADCKEKKAKKEGQCCDKKKEKECPESKE